MSERAQKGRRNRFQKAAYRPGEVRVGRAHVPELLVMARSGDVEDRLHAAKYLCPCHVRGRTQEIWAVVLRLMEDEDPRVRQAAWHQLEDGGVPTERGVLEALEARYRAEQDPAVLTFARFALGDRLAERERVALAAMRRPAPAMRGKCDFCGVRDARVRQDFETLIPTSAMPRPALICEACERAAA